MKMFFSSVTNAKSFFLKAAKHYDVNLHNNYLTAILALTYIQESLNKIGV